MNTKQNLFLLACCCFSLPAMATLNIFACEPEWSALAKEIGGEKVTTFSATTGLQDPHHIQARPSLIAKVRAADLIICTGAGLEEGWLPLLLRRSGNANIQQGQAGYFIATNYVRILGKPKLLDRSQGDVHAAGNPHIQTDPRNILIVAKALQKRLIKLEPENRKFYISQFDDFSMRWKQYLKHWKKITRPLQQLPVVVHHNSWIYMQNYLNLDQVATLEDKPGIPPTSGHLSKLLKQMKQSPAKIIIHAAYQPAKASEWLSKRTGIVSIKLAFTIGGNQQATDLFSLYEDTFNRLLKAAK